MWLAARVQVTVIQKQIGYEDDTLMAKCHQILKPSQAIGEDQENENTGASRNVFKLEAQI